MVNVARRNNLPWDAILGSEIAQGHKAQPKVYLMTCDAFNLKPEQVMMCAAHSGDVSFDGEHCERKQQRKHRPRSCDDSTDDATPKPDRIFGKDKVEDRKHCIGVLPGAWPQNPSFLARRAACSV
jgi:2-haloacid dehalogenase